MVRPRARFAVATGVVALGAMTWFSLARHPTSSEIEVCRSVLARNVEATAAEWRAHARGEDVPDEHSDLSSACAPLYSLAACREAWLHGNEGDPSSRPRRLAETCRDAYCPKLSPKPSLCERDATSPAELTFMWRELDDAILSHELGDRAKPIHEVRRRGAHDIQEAMDRYFDAGSPPWRSTQRRGSAMDVRAFPSVRPGDRDR